MEGGREDRWREGERKESKELLSFPCPAQDRQETS